MKLPAIKVSSETVGTAEAIGTITVGGTTYTKYRKIIDFGKLPSTAGTPKFVASGISNLHRVLNIYGIATNGGTTGYNTMPLPNASYYLERNISVSLETNGDIAVITATDRSGWYGLVTIEYY